MTQEQANPQDIATAQEVAVQEIPEANTINGNETIGQSKTEQEVAEQITRIGKKLAQRGARLDLSSDPDSEKGGLYRIKESNRAVIGLKRAGSEKDETVQLYADVDKRNTAIGKEVVDTNTGALKRVTVLSQNLGEYGHEAMTHVETGSVSERGFNRIDSHAILGKDENVESSAKILSELRSATSKEKTRAKEAEQKRVKDIHNDVIAA